MLIIGWDGADWDILDDLIARGELPNVAELIRDGARGTLLSTIPINSWAAWPTFLTGTDPARHGVFDFIERHPSKRGVRLPVFSGSIRVRTFLERLSDAGHEVRAGNIPVTFPPFPVHGRMISGGAIPPGAEFVYPPAWRTVLDARAPFPIGGMEWTRFESNPESLIEEARLLIRQRTASFEALLEGEWSVATCVYVATDRLQHPLGDHLLPSHPRYARVVDSRTAEDLRSTYRLLDDSLGRLRAAAGRGTTTLLVSDHGFEPVDRAYDLNAILVRQGLADQGLATGAAAAVRRSGVWRTLSGTPVGAMIRRFVRRPSALDWSRTVAYQSASGEGVSVNLKGREPEGVVEPKDFERTREQVREALLAFEDDELGKPIRDVVRAEDFYNSDTQLAPDLLALPNPLWVPDHTDRPAAPLRWPTGDHRRSGVVVAQGDDVLPGDLGERQLTDIAATVLASFGLPFSTLDGRPIREISPSSDGDGSEEVAIAARRSSDGMSDEDVESVTAHLRSLGYVE